MKYDTVYVVLTYKNIDDIQEFIKSLDNVKNQKNFKVIIVNSYYDDNSKNIISKIALENNCDFINIENKGYGYGNNIGIDYAKKNYNFEYLIISNPDIIIKNFDLEIIKNYKGAVIAPKIQNLNGKNQNPHIAYNVNLIKRLKYLGFKHNLRILVYKGIILNKILNKISMIKLNKKIFACHGSFFIIHNTVLQKMDKIYNEEMFLFAEEDHLGEILKLKDIYIYYLDKIEIIHKEDGSMGDLKKYTYSLVKDSYIKYYENINGRVLK